MVMEYVGEGSLRDIRDRLPKRRGQVAFDNTGFGVAVFDPPIVMARDPFIQFTPAIQANGDLVIANRVEGTFVKNAAGAYVSVQVKGGRVRGSLPTLTPLSGVLTLVSQVVTGVNAIVTALTGLTLVNTATISGVKVDWQAS